MDNINYDVARAKRSAGSPRRDEHVYAFGQQCPKAAGSHPSWSYFLLCGDNTDIILMRDALLLIRKKLVNVIAELSSFAMKYKDMPTLAFTHFQPAQPTTVGKRATLWCNEFMMDLEDLDYVLST